MNNEKKYLYYILSIGTMPRISVCKLEVRSMIDRTVVPLVNMAANRDGEKMVKS